MFLADVMPNINIKVAALPYHLLNDLIKAQEQFNFDFDDAYQYCLAQENNLTIVTMDKDFKDVDNGYFGIINVVSASFIYNNHEYKLTGPLRNYSYFLKSLINLYAPAKLES